MHPVVIRVAHAEAALFASDMHLDDADPDLTSRFLLLLDAAVAAVLADRPVATAACDEAPALFLMGDLFEYWIGDDHVPSAAQALAGRLTAFAGAGGRIFLMHGNRDFLIDAALPPDGEGNRGRAPPFSASCGARLLSDPAVIEVAGRRIALSHGDALCTDDTRYQQWRTLCRSPEWQRGFLARPVPERLAMARSLRQESKEARLATETASDANQAAVDELMTRLDAPLLIHGHTHRPGRHRWPKPGNGAGRERQVLSDWAVSPPRGEVRTLAAMAKDH